MDDNWSGVGGLALTAVKKGHRVVFLDTVGDYSMWPTTQGREKEVGERVAGLAEQHGIELRRLGYDYMHVPDDNEIMTTLAEHAEEIQPDILFFPWFEDTNRDHWKTGLVGLYGCMRAACFLARRTRVAAEAYAYELGSNQCRNFRPEIYFDISAVFPELIALPLEFDRIYAGAPDAASADPVLAEIEDLRAGQTYALSHHARLLYALALIRGSECGARYAEAFHAYHRRPIGRMLDL
jgi:hypothetical protein